MSLKYFKCYVPITAGLMCLLLTSCTQHLKNAGELSFREDSIKVRVLLRKGNDVYSHRGSMSQIGESLLYFDSAHNMAQRLGDTVLLANTLFFIGNVYNAWNGEPQKTVDYYSRSAALFSSQSDAASRVREFYLRYLIAHSFDSEKANDSIRCVQTIVSAIKDIEAVPEYIKDSMNYLSDFAWVATNIKNYGLAERILNNLSVRPKNDPESNNYLDHYYLAKARIDIYQYRHSSVYLDSIVESLKFCNNKFDSGYYSLNLAQLYEQTGDYKSAFYYSRLSNTVEHTIEKSDVLTALRTQIMNSELEVGKEKERRSREEIKIKNLYLYGAALGVIIAFLSWILYSIYQKRKTVQLQIKQQESFTQQLLHKEEDERKRIAMELHDGVNHELLTMKNNIILNKPLRIEDVENIINSVRDMSRNLYPVLFESVGLQASVEALCKNLTDAGFFTTCEINYNKLLNKNEELQLYRIIQEALQNTAKHSHGEACKITIKCDDHNLLVEIKDNGLGFDSKSVQVNSFGLQSMRQRAKAFSAGMFIESSKTGTIVKIIKNLA